MTFTESDAKNDGLIKREVGREMAKVAKTQNPQLFEHFERVCDEVGRNASEVFGEMAVRSLNNEDFANRVLGSEINMGNIRADEIRLEDVKYVKELSEELGLNQQEEKEDPIDRLINQRLEMVTSSPLDNIRRNKESPEGVNGEVLQHMESLQQEINNLKSEIDNNNKRQQEEDEEDQTGNQTVDDLFGGGDSDEDVDDVPGDVVDGPVDAEVEDQASEGETSAESEDDQITDEEIEEALGDSVTFEGSGPDEQDDSSTTEWDDMEDEGGDDNPFVTSEDGEEE